MIARVLKPLCVLLLVAALVSVVSGCRLFGDDDESITAGPAISGRVTRAGVANVNASLKADVADTPVAGARVWLESEDGSLYASYVLTNASGEFVLTNVPAGSYRIVARYQGNDGQFINRSEFPVAGGGTIALVLRPGTNKVAGYLKGPNGQPLPRGTTIVLWGQPFTIDSDDGYFATPPIPEDVASATLNIPGTTLYNAFAFLAPFILGNDPLVIDVLLPSQGTANHPPTALVFPMVDGAVSNRPAGGKTVIFKATGKDIDAGDEANLSYTWTVEDNKGTIQAGQGTNEMTWMAPGEGGIATVTLTVKDPQNATGGVRVPIIMPGPANYTLTTEATNGSVGKAPSQTTYDHGTVVTLTATPNAGYLFAGWTGSVVSNDNPVQVTMTSSKTVTANFARLNLAFNHGRVTFAQTGVQITLTGVASPGYVISGWISNPPAFGGTGSPKTFAMSQETTVFGAFSKRVTLWPQYGHWVIADNGSVSFTLLLPGNIRARELPIITPTGSYVAWDITQNIAVGVKTDGSLDVQGEENNVGGSLSDLLTTKPSGTNFVEASVGVFSGFALKTDGTISAWGTRAGNGTVGPDNNADVVSLAKHGAPIALKRDGSITVWNPMPGFIIRVSSLPTDAQGPGFIAVAGDPASEQYAALKADGTLVIWMYTMGTPTKTYTEADIVSIGSSNDLVVGVKKDGSLIAYLGSGSSWPVHAMLTTNLNNLIPAGKKAVACDASNGSVVITLDDGSVKTYDTR